MTLLKKLNENKIVSVKSLHKNIYLVKCGYCEYVSVHNNESGCCPKCGYVFNMPELIDKYNNEG